MSSFILKIVVSIYYYFSCCSLCRIAIMGIYSTQGATVAVVTQGTSRGEEQTGNTHDDNSTQGATVAVATVAPCVELSSWVFPVCSSPRLVPCVTTATVAPCV
jgi:hypothetical protein